MLGEEKHMCIHKKKEDEEDKFFLKASDFWVENNTLMWSLQLSIDSRGINNINGQ